MMRLDLQRKLKTVLSGFHQSLAKYDIFHEIQ